MRWWLIPALAAFSCSSNTGPRLGDREPCAEDAECQTGWVCERGECSKLCNNSGECAAPDQFCDGGICDVIPNPTCRSDEECTSPETCDATGVDGTCFEGECSYDDASDSTPCDLPGEPAGSAGGVCFTGVCLRTGSGVPCGGASPACTGGTVCVDGVCCESTCDGQCMGCTEALTGQPNGACRAITIDLEDTAASTPCAAASGCSADTCACDGSGICAAATGSPCFQDTECISGDCACTDAACSARVCSGAGCAGCESTADGVTCGAPLTSGILCRPSAGPCDITESCDGASPTCPTDGFLDNTTTCRDALGSCDVPEMCTGSAAACPDDVLVPLSLTCRVSAQVCDEAEVCSGTSGLCPMDLPFPDNTSCGTNLECIAGNCQCVPGMYWCDANMACISDTTCCTNTECTEANEVCSGPGGTCVCDMGFKYCSVNDACIANSSCCTTAADCSPGSTQCSGPGGVCQQLYQCPTVGAPCPCPSNRCSGQIQTGSTCTWCARGGCNAGSCCGNCCGSAGTASCTPL